MLDYCTDQSHAGVSSQCQVSHTCVRVSCHLNSNSNAERDSEDEDDDLSSEEEGGAKSRAYTERTTHTMATSAAVSHR